MRPPDADTDFASTDPRDDGELLRRYVEARDEAAFAALVSRRVNLVYRAALRQLNGDVHRAQEATQVVFTVLARKAPAVARHPSLAGWLYTTTHYAVNDVLRSERRQRARETEAHMRMEIEGGGDAAEWERLRPVLDGVLRELNERDREAILARFFEGRAFAELGRRFASSEDAARMRVERALEKLRALLARRGVTSTVVALGGMLATEAAHAVPAGLAATVTGTALASAATVGPVAAAIQFMITSKTAASIVGTVVLAAALGTAVHETHARQASTRALEAATAEMTRVEAQVRDLRGRAAAAEQARDETSATLAKAEAAAKSAAAPANASNEDALAAGRALLAEHPEAQALWDERERANLESKFAPIFQALNLTTNEREQMETIFIRTISGVTTFGGPGGTIALRREPTLTQAEAQEQMLALLGPERLQKFVDMSKLAPTFDLTVKLASAVYRTEPLTPEQSTRMMEIFANQSLAARARGGSIDWNTVQERAGTILSTQQLAGLTAVQRNFEYQQALAKVGKAATEAALGAKPGNAPAR